MVDQGFDVSMSHGQSPEIGDGTETDTEMPGHIARLSTPATLWIFNAPRSRPTRHVASWRSNQIHDPLIST
eukprot:CAMPEP_0206546210 /NCGR_PEP_ID=MMETSP0325_2-20121206/12575_1 /ASSEMBLY_ACC=CAM_ASM_000347 /TAXON_ID=2866 /ORGANISM="Crypthecodinium cohnii, Strain Seligo" /LENGTH=70 /DNA_ID=CAMNT_0054045301 /DNA_START=94 /DNA_END=302 /DNA_ORIENTATION=-